MSSSTYPPDPHYLRDLRLEISATAECTGARFEIVPQLCSAAGELRAGILATALDISAGGLAGSLAAPDWVATSDISWHRTGSAPSGIVVIDTAVVRRGRSLIVLHSDVSLDGGSTRVGVVTSAFAILPSRGKAQGGRSRAAAAASSFPTAERPLGEPIIDKLGIHGVTEMRGEFELDHSAYVENTFGALQGGIAAVLSDLAAENHGEAAWGEPAITTDLRIRYLSQARVGPFRTSTEILNSSTSHLLCQVEVRDRGDGDRLATLATATVVRGCQLRAPGGVG